MKLVRFSLILNLFRSTKNFKKFIILINIGIFLSIFAVSSSLVSFYIEKKINDLEFKIVNEQIEIKDTAKQLSYIRDLRTKMHLSVNKENDNNNLYEYISNQSISGALISVNDVYLPELVVESEIGDFNVLIEIFEGEYSIMDMRKDIAEGYGEDSWQVMQMDIFIKNFDSIKNFKIKKYSKYYKKIFSFNLINLSDEINDGTSIKDFNDPIYKDYIKLFEIYRNLDSFAALSESLLFDIKFNSEEILQNLNNDLLRYSKNERNIIIFAFFFQIIMFLIIQIFEVTSLQKEMKNKRLRKK